MKKNVFFVAIALIVTSCGIFTPGNVEDPNLKTSSETSSDSFHLSSILEETGGHFSKTAYEYEDILSPDFQFIAWDNAVYSREAMLEQLKKLKVSCDCSIAWDTCEGVGEIRNENTMTICRTFLVTHSSTGAISDSGKLEFTLNQSSVNTWIIVQWKERLTRSIFHP
jgi:hypothetical protein